MKIDISSVALGISILSFIGGLISHFFIVVKKQVEIETRLKQVESDVSNLKKHIPIVERSINEVHRIVTAMDARQEIMMNQLKR